MSRFELQHVTTDRSSAHLGTVRYTCNVWDSVEDTHADYVVTFRGEGRELEREGADWLTDELERDAIQELEWERANGDRS